MSKGQKLRRQIMANKSAAAKDGSSDQGDSDGRGDVKNKDIIARTGFYFAPSPRHASLSPKKKTNYKKQYNKPKPRPTAAVKVPQLQENENNQSDSDYYCADNKSQGFYYEVGGNKGWLRYPPEIRETSAQLFNFSLPPARCPGSPVTTATTTESISSRESLEDSTSPFMSSSSNGGSCLSLNTTFDSGNGDYGWSYAVYKNNAESSAASMASPIEGGQDPDWNSGPDSPEEETLAQQIKQVSILWD